MKEKTKIKIEWTATIIGIIGAILNALALKQGFYFWLVSDISLAFVAYKYKHWGLFLLFCTYSVIVIIGIIYW